MHFNILWLFFEKIGASLLSVVVFFYYAKLLEPEEFGVAVIILSVTQFTAILISMLFEDTIVQQKHEEDIDYDTSFWGGVIVSLLAMGLCIAGFNQWGKGQENPDILPLAAFATLEILFTNIMTIYVARCRRNGDFKSLAVRVLIGRMTGAMLGLGCLLYGLGALSIIMQSVAGCAIQMIILLVRMRQFPKFRFSSRYFFAHAGFGTLLAMRRLLWDLLVRLTPIIGGAVGGVAVAGHIGFAWRIVELIRSSIGSSIYSYVLPILSRHQQDRQQLANIHKNTTQIIAFFVTPIFLGLAVIAPDMVRAIFDPRWHDTDRLIQLFSIASLLSLYTIMSPLTLTAIRKPGKMLPTDIMATIVTLLGMWQYGTIGLWVFGALHIARAVFVAPISTFWLYRMTGIKPHWQWWPVAKFMFPGLAMFAALEALDYYHPLPDATMMLLLKLGAGAVIFALIALIGYRSSLLAWKRGMKR